MSRLFAAVIGCVLVLGACSGERQVDRAEAAPDTASAHDRVILGLVPFSEDQQPPFDHQATLAEGEMVWRPIRGVVHADRLERLLRRLEVLLGDLLDTLDDGGDSGHACHAFGAEVERYGAHFRGLYSETTLQDTVEATAVRDDGTEVASARCRCFQVGLVEEGTQREA